MGDTYEPHRRRRAEKSVSTGRTTLFVIVLTIIAAAVVALAASRLSSDRAGVAAFRAAPNCASSVSSTVAATLNCKEVAAYTVTYSDQQGSGGPGWKAFIGLQSSSGGQLNLQFALPGNESGFADDGDTVTLISWHGVPIFVANSTLTAELVNPLLESGNGPYTWLWYTSAVYLFLLPLLITQRRSRLLVLAPAALLAAGLYLHGQVVGGDWLHCYLWVGLIAALLYYIYAGRHLRFIGRLLRR